MTLDGAGAWQVDNGFVLHASTDFIQKQSITTAPVMILIWLLFFFNYSSKGAED